LYGTLLTNGEKVTSRVGDAYQLTNVMLVLTNPKNSLVMSPTRNVSTKYLLGEMKFYESSSNSLEDIAKYSSFWRKVSDDDKTVNSAYGYIIYDKYGFDQFSFAHKNLVDNKYSRQAVLNIKHADNRPTKDMNCTISIQFTISNNKLHCATNMRSNDIWFGLPYDMAYFTYLQNKMFHKLKETYPDLELGEYVHFVGNIHLYDKNVKDKYIPYEPEEDIGDWLKDPDKLSRLVLMFDKDVNSVINAYGSKDLNMLRRMNNDFKHK